MRKYSHEIDADQIKTVMNLAISANYATEEVSRVKGQDIELPTGYIGRLEKKCNRKVVELVKYLKSLGI